MSKKARSPAGDNIVEHSSPVGDDGSIAHADDERITAHLERTLGKPDFVWHEIMSDRVHIDVHVIKATPDRPYITLVSAGMSARPMTLPADATAEDKAEWSHAELCIFLPPDWPLEGDTADDETNYWPVRLLKALARLPHAYGTWLDSGHSIPNGHPAEPFAPDTKLAGAIIVVPEAQADEFFVVPGEPTMHLFQILPVTAAEMNFKLKAGVEKLLDRLEKKFPDIYGPIDRARKSAV